MPLTRVSKPESLVAVKAAVVEYSLVNGSNVRLQTIRVNCLKIAISKVLNKWVVVNSSCFLKAQHYLNRTSFPSSQSLIIQVCEYYFSILQIYFQRHLRVKILGLKCNRRMVKNYSVVILLIHGGLP